MAAKTVTTTIPIVAVVGDDPVRTGLVPNLNRPGGNVTGVTFTTVDVSGKRLSLLQELVPGANVFAALLDPNLVEFDSELRAIQAAAKIMGRSVEVVKAGTAQELDAAFTTIVKAGGQRVQEWREPRSVAGHLDHLLPKPLKLTRGHHAAMSYENVPKFIGQLRKRDATAALALEFCILTAARSGEVFGMRWPEIDMDKNIWTVPATRMKAGVNIAFPCLLAP